MSTQFDPVEEGIAAIKAGEMVVVVDDDDRENEGDLIMAASKATQEQVAFMIRHTSGILCTPILEEQAHRLRLDPMVARNDAPMSTAFTVSIDYKQGLTTGISAGERAATVQALTTSNAVADDFVRPGHIFPLVARKGGVLVRSGHTEAGTDLAALAGCPPVGLLAELVNDDGSVQRLPQLIEFAKTHHLKLISIGDLISYRQIREQLVERTAELLHIFRNHQVRQERRERIIRRVADQRRDPRAIQPGRQHPAAQRVDLLRIEIHRDDVTLGLAYQFFDEAPRVDAQHQRVTLRDAGLFENLGRLLRPVVRLGRDGGLRRLMKQRLAGSLRAEGVNTAFERRHD